MLQTEQNQTRIMLNVKGSVIDKSFGSNPALPFVNVYGSDEKGKPLQPVKSTTTDDNGVFLFSVDDNVKFISARVNSENILTKPVASVLNFDFSNVSAKVLDEVVIIAKKPKVIIKKPVKKENLFLKYLPQGLFALTGVIIIISSVIYISRKK